MRPREICLPRAGFGSVRLRCCWKWKALLLCPLPAIRKRKEFDSFPMIIALGTTPTIQRTMSFERLSFNTVHRAVDVHEHASGKAINAARVLRALGAEVLAIGFVGGTTGTMMR